MGRVDAFYTLEDGLKHLRILSYDDSVLNRCWRTGQYGHSCKNIKRKQVEYMIRGYQNIERMTQNLIDAGCSEAVISCFLSCLQHGDKAGSLCQLEEWRAELLSEIHKEQSCIEFLDEQLCILKEQLK